MKSLGYPGETSFSCSSAIDPIFIYDTGITITQQTITTYVGRHRHLTIYIGEHGRHNYQCTQDQPCLKHLCFVIFNWHNRAYQ